MSLALPIAADGRSATVVAEAAIRAAGAVVADAFAVLAAGGQVTVDRKGWNNLVTEVDRASETAILDILRSAFPGIAVLSEEAGEIGVAGDHPGDYQWVLDPVDGTRNLASGLPHVAVNVRLAWTVVVIALVLALTYDPQRDELFKAEAGAGATLNGTRIHVADAESLRECVVGFDMGYVEDYGHRLLAMVSGLWPEVQTVRVMGSIALGMAYVAAGRLQVYGHHHAYRWDRAPGLLLVREAGGVVTDLRGANAALVDGPLACGAPLAHAAFMRASEGTAWREIK